MAACRKCAYYQGNNACVSYGYCTDCPAADKGETMSTSYGPSSDFAPRPWLAEADYYKAGGLDIRAVIEAFGLNFNEGSILKYVTRRKPGNTRLMDLKKARVHLEREIAREEATAPHVAPPPPAMRAQAGSFSNAGMDDARKQMQDSGFSFGQSVEPERLVPRQVCPADDVTTYRPGCENIGQGAEGGTFISRPLGVSIPPTA